MAPKRSLQMVRRLWNAYFAGTLSIVSVLYMFMGNVPMALIYGVLALFFVAMAFLTPDEKEK